jgi:lipoate-protein ligase A
MAGDVALLEAFQRGEIPPTLRVYQWASPALTYGVNQQLPPRLVDACNALGIPMLRRPTGGKAVLHGHDLTVGLVFRYVALTPSPSPTQWERRAESALTPSPSSTGRERGAAHHAFWSAEASASASGGSSASALHNTPRQSFWSAEASASASGGSSASALQTPPRPCAGEGDTGGEGDTNTRPYPRQVYQFLAPVLIEAFAQVGVPAVQGSAPAPDPRNLDDGGDCFATPAIADLVHAETGVKLMGCALLVRGACVLMQASIPLRPPTVPVERLFGHPHPAPPPLDADALTDALYRTLTRVIHTPANAINTAP